MPYPKRGLVIYYFRHQYLTILKKQAFVKSSLFIPNQLLISGLINAVL